MTEIEWLKQESGLTDEELKAWEATLGDAKFKGFLTKIMKTAETEGAARVKAETELSQFIDQYQNKFVPEMRKVAEDSLKSEGEVARLKAELARAKEYGIVPVEETKNEAPPRAAGSPDPNYVSRDDFGKFSNAQANTVVALQNLSAEHFGLFGSPLGDVDGLVAEVNKQRSIGNKNFSLKDAWEAKYNVSGKRQEIQAASQKKHDDEVRAAAVREERERFSANPNLRSGQPSRFSMYRATDAKGNAKPWQSERGERARNASWRENASAKVREAAS